MRKFKHKILSCEAIWHEDIESIVTIVQINLFNETILRPVKDILSSKDREEVIEQDWIEDAFKCYRNQYENNVFSEIDNINFRYACEKYAPKVRKFTRDEVCKWSNKAYFDGAEERYLIDFLEEHNLLSKDTEGETSE